MESFFGFGLVVGDSATGFHLGVELILELHELWFYQTFEWSPADGPVLCGKPS
jgi:hypothetical protein